MEYSRARIVGIVGGIVVLVVIAALLLANLNM
jgi:hypothetical protein